MSACFAYWHYQGETYGINVVSSEDCDRFCAIVRVGGQSQWTSQMTSATLFTTVTAHIMQLFEVENGIIKHKNGPFVDCVIKLAPNGALVRMSGRDFSLNLVSSSHI